jgi:hypothetical protein
MEPWRQQERRRHVHQECAMFDQPASLPMRAAIASLLGGLFGVAMILVTNSAQSQTPEADPSVVTNPAAATGASITRLGDAALRSMRGTEPAAVGGIPGARGLRINDSGNESGSGLRWQTAPKRVLRSEIENPRVNDQLSLGLQVRF